MSTSANKKCNLFILLNIFTGQKYKKIMEYTQTKSNNFDIYVKNSNFAGKI